MRKQGLGNILRNPYPGEGSHGATDADKMIGPQGKMLRDRQARYIEKKVAQPSAPAGKPARQAEPGVLKKD